MSGLSWKPVRKGRIYCAPACGHNCTHAEYLEAVRKGDRLAKRLGTGWKGQVDENLGWHYRAVKGKCEVHETKRSKLPYWFNLLTDVKQFCFSTTNLKEGLREMRRRVIKHAATVLSELGALDRP